MCAIYTAGERERQAAQTLEYIPLFKSQTAPLHHHGMVLERRMSTAAGGVYECVRQYILQGTSPENLLGRLSSRLPVTE